LSGSRAAIPDVVIVGAGHNGLVCACYLAAAGLKVRVLERRHVVGGAAVTEEFFPGFRNSTASYTVSLLHPRVIADLRLREHGLTIVERPFSNFLPLPDGTAFRLGGGLAATQAEIARFAPRDAERLPAYYAMLDTVAAQLKAALLETPPNVRGRFGLESWRDWITAARVLKRLNALDWSGKRALLDLFTKSAGDILDAWFECEPLKAAMGFDSVVGHYASPYTPGSGYVLLHHVFGEVNGKPGIWGHAIGGMGSITQAMAAEARARGVEISVSAPVAEVTTAGGRVTGVVLDGGDEIAARAVASNVNPKLLYQRLIAAAALPEAFRRAIDGYRCGSGTFRMNVALAELPRFAAAPHPGPAAAPHHSSGIVMAPSLAYMDRAYRDAVETGMSGAPIVEMLIPSTVDDSLAPPGRHVASLFCQQFAPELPDGRSWADEREAAVRAIFAVVDRSAPNFSASVLGYRALSPLDLENELGLVGGDIFHGVLSLDQLYSARPLLGYANYRGPLEGLYHCGSGAHPGGGVTGVPGHNAAREILRDLGRKPA
jgi:phytoene dehydrogenase-like protein